MLPGTFALIHCPIAMSRRHLAAAWKSFLSVTGIGLALLFAAGTSLAQGIDHAPFDALLRANVKNGVVNYSGFQNNAAFKQYVESLSKPAKLETKADQIAYYSNAYNALAIQGILDGLSPSSFLGRARYFKTKEWPLNGRNITLYDLEHKILRPLGDPRVHFAIICASKSCPFLRSEVYSAAKLEGQLDEQAKQFINDPFRNRFDKATKTAHLSEIFKWFDEDFSGPAGSAQKYIAKYVADQDAAKGLAGGSYLTEWIPYDWSLNGTPPK
ncbi:MAG: DUF547 domain-containing protein [Betaproteobacteria bacterium]|nr:DUF547 domain-containing protein [Betaproteobacteria bacterium]